MLTVGTRLVINQADDGMDVGSGCRSQLDWALWHSRVLDSRRIIVPPFYAVTVIRIVSIPKYNHRPDRLTSAGQA